MLVGELESGLLGLFPSEAAEPWDRTGMLVGDPSAEVSGVAVALDPTVGSIDFAVENGCNVLLTHHPLFLEPPESVKPLVRGCDAAGARIWRAVSAGVSVISFHTALDVSPRAAKALAAALGLQPDGAPLEPVGSGESVGYGRICDAGDLSLDELAGRCRSAFGHAPRVWGRGDSRIGAVCLWTGAAGDAPHACLARGIGALVCGEVKYHAALDACEQGLGIVELGHDVSEQVLCGVLVESLEYLGFAPERIHPRALPGIWQ